MASTGSRNDPMQVFRFEIKMDEMPVGAFMECTGLQMELEVQDYNEGGWNAFVRKFPGRTKQTNLVLKRGIVDRLMYDWFADMTQGRVRFRNGSILLRDPSGGQVLAEWRFTRAFPTKWIGPDLNAMQNNVAVETLELAHQGLERRQ